MVNNELSYDILWQTYQKEKRSNELQLVPKTFYDDMAAFLNGMDSSVQSTDSSVQKENAARLLNGIFEKRKQKILIYAAYGKQLPGPVPQREADLYEEAIKLMKADTLAPAKAGSGKAQAEVHAGHTGDNTALWRQDRPA